MNRPAGGPLHIAVVGGGLAGMTAALACADAGARVTLVEKRKHLGGLTWSFEHDGLSLDNGQHVFLRCCTAYLDFLGRIGSAGDVELQDRLDVTVLRAAADGGPPRQGRLRRDRLVPPLLLARSLLAYGLVPWAQRSLVGPAVVALMRADLDDPSLDEETFAHWLRRHHQGDAAVAALWELICLATVNLRAEEASAAMAAKVFKTGLLTTSGGADIGWSRVPLGLLHGHRGLSALQKAGVEVRLGESAGPVRRHEGGQWAVPTSGRPDVVGDKAVADGLVPNGAVADEVVADGVVVALPHYNVEAALPTGALGPGVRPGALGSSPIVNVHVHFDRPVTELPVAAGLGTVAQWVFDRTASSGANRGQYLAVSISGADREVGLRPDQLGSEAVDALRAIFPPAKEAKVLSTFVTREHHATFRASPGSSAHRPPARTPLPGLALAGAWTSTGWPPTMESAVRSGTQAARAVLVSCGQREGLPPIPREAADD
jgi:squalene-associated FAD-dependent desaturase